MNLSQLTTEQRNPRTLHIDEVPTLELVRLINEEDQRVPQAVAAILPDIARAVDLIAARLAAGGRLFYIGAGTSGRLGILDAVECPPTYRTDPERIQGIIAGGTPAIFRAQEGAEDSEELGARDLAARGFSAGDIACGIAASGRTPYVIGALRHARACGGATIALACSEHAAIASLADIALLPITGPEAVTGSTRMKAGTAQKLVLNMFSTISMVRNGKAYGNLMVDVKPTNEKLVRRCVTIVCEATGEPEGKAVQALESCDYHCKTAIVMLLCGKSADEARALLHRADGRVAEALCLKD